jgi:hypothetical protein
MYARSKILLIQSIKHLDELEIPSKAPKLSDEVIASHPSL